MELWNIFWLFGGIFFGYLGKIVVRLINLTLNMNMIVDQEAPQDVEAVVGPHYKLIVDIVMRGWDIWLTGADHFAKQLPGITHRNRTIGSTMNDILRTLFKLHTVDFPSIVFRQPNGLFLIVIDDEIVIRFNLMDKNGKTLYTPTKQAKAFLNQKLLFAEKPLKYLYAGFVIDGSKTSILNVFLLERTRTGEPSWRIDMNGNVTQQMPYPYGTSVNETNEETRRVSPKKKSAGGDTQQPKTGTDNV